MTRSFLPRERIAPDALDFLSRYHRATVDEVAAAVAAHRVVVVGMAQNPFVRKARKVLDRAGVSYTYLEYGSYFSMWKPRLAVKLWSGWPTFPQVFVDGVLIGGCAEAEAALRSGRLAA